MFRNIVTAVAVLALTASTSFATLLVHDDFTRADGNLVGTNPTPGPGDTWVPHSGAGAVPVQIASGTIGLVQGSGSREDVNVGFGGTAAGAGDVFYAAFDFTGVGTSPVTSTYFAMFLEGTSFFNARIWMTEPAAGGDFRLAISNDSSITDADGEAFSIDLSSGTMYRLVVSYDYTAAAGKLWINPINQASASITAADPGFSDEVHAFAFRQAAGNTSQTMDNLCVATDFNEALFCVPEPGTISLLALGALVAIRRRK